MLVTELDAVSVHVREVGAPVSITAEDVFKALLTESGVN